MADRTEGHVQIGYEVGLRRVQRRISTDLHPRPVVDRLPAAGEALRQETPVRRGNPAVGAPVRVHRVAARTDGCRHDAVGGRCFTEQFNAGVRAELLRRDRLGIVM